MIAPPCSRHRLVGKFLTAPLSLVLLAAGVAKLAGPHPADAPFVLSPTALQALAAIDVLLALGLWIPRLSTLSTVRAVHARVRAEHARRGATPRDGLKRAARQAPPPGA